MFFDVFSKLCEEKGVSRYKACTDVGLNRAAVAKWKNGAIPTGATLSKLSAYFGVTTDYLLGTETEKAPTLEGEREITDRDVQVAFFRGADLPDDQMDALWQDARDYINYKISQMKKDEK